MLENDGEESSAVLRIIDGAANQGFRKALNGGQRGAEFVRDVGDKVAADALKAAQFGDVMKDDDCAGSFSRPHSGYRGSKIMLAKCARDDFGLDAGLSGQHTADRFN